MLHKPEELFGFVVFWVSSNESTMCTVVVASTQDGEKFITVCKVNVVDKNEKFYS